MQVQFCVGRILWRRAWQLAPVFLLGELPGQRSLVGYRPWDHKESDTTKQLSAHTYTHTHTLVHPSDSNVTHTFTEYVNFHIFTWILFGRGGLYKIEIIFLSKFNQTTNIKQTSSKKSMLLPGALNSVLKQLIFYGLCCRTLKYHNSFNVMPFKSRFLMLV